MSRQIFHRYFLCYLLVSAILVYGSSRRIPRRALCPSCGKDCPEALASPWYPEDLQIGNPNSFNISPLRNSLYSYLTQGVVQELTRSDVLSKRNSRCPALPPMRFVDDLRQQNSFSTNLPDESTEMLIQPRSFPQETLESRYPFFHILPWRRFVEPEQKNMFFRNPRDKYSMPLLEIEEFENGEENSANRLSNVYHKNEKPSWEDLKRTSVIEILPQNPFTFRPANIYDEKEDAIEEFASSVSERFNPAFKKDNFPVFNVSEVKRDPYTLPQDLDNRKSTNEFNFWNYIKDSNEASKPSRINAFEAHPVEERKKIVTEDVNKQSDYNPYKPFRNSNIWQSAINQESNNRNPMMHKLQEFAKIDEFKAAEDQQPKVYPVMRKDMIYYGSEGDKDQKSFEDEIEVDIDPLIYNPYAPANKKIWTSKQNEELFDYSDVTMDEGLQKNSKQLKVHPVQGIDGKDFQDEKNERIIQDEINNNGNTSREPFIDITSPFLRQIYLGFLNAAEKSAMKHMKREDLLEIKNNALHASNQDKSFSNDALNAKEHDYADDTKSKESGTKDNAQAKSSIAFDPDLIIDIENPPVASTEVTPCILS